jgi:hypothetical protein
MNELHDKLWDYVYGLLDEAEAEVVRRQITSDRDVAREYARVKLQSELVAQAAKAAEPARELPRWVEKTQRWSAETNRRGRLIVAMGSLALSLGLVLYAGLSWTNQTALQGDEVAQALEQRFPRLLVTGKTELAEGTVNYFDLQVETVTGEPLSLPVEASLDDIDGNRLWSKTYNPDSNGAVRLELPREYPEDTYRLSVRAAGTEANDAAPAALETWMAVDHSRRSGAPAGDLYYFGSTESRSRSELAAGKQLESLESRKSLAMQRVPGESKPRTEKMTEELNQPEAEKLQRDEKGQKDVNREKKFGDASRDAPAKRPQPAPESDEAKKDNKNPNAEDRPANPPAAPQAETPAPATSPKEAMPIELPSLQPAGGAGPTPARSLDHTSRYAIPAATPPPVAGFDGAETARSRVIAAESDKKVLVEAVTADNKLVLSRLAKGKADESSLRELIEEVQQQGLIETSKDVTVVKGVLYDPSFAPPQKLAEVSTELRSPVEPLACAVKFDKPCYRAGDWARIDVCVTTNGGEPAQCNLAVEVDAVSLELSDLEPATEFVVDGTSNSFHAVEAAPVVPLLFDNADQQERQLEQAISTRLAGESQSRRGHGWLLLGGSGIGYALLGVAALLSWLPRRSVWLPIAGLLLCCSATGTLWVVQDEAKPAHSPTMIAAATSYGVNSSPPVRAMSEKLGKETTLALRNELKEQLPDFDTPNQQANALAPTQRLALLARSLEAPRPPSDRISLDDNVALSYESLPTPNDWSEALSRTEGEGLTQLARDYSLLANGRLGLDVLGTPQSSPTGSPRHDEREPLPVYWHPLLSTDSQGIARITCAIPPGPLAYRLTVFCQKGSQKTTWSELIPTVVATPSP